MASSAASTQIIDLPDLSDLTALGGDTLDVLQRRVLPTYLMRHRWYGAKDVGAPAVTLLDKSVLDTAEGPVLLTTLLVRLVDPSRTVVWLSIQTTPGGDDDKARSDLRAWLASKNAAPTASIIDSTGNIGRTYGARTTPHMYIVDPKGTLIYAGAIDSIPSADKADIAKATQHVPQALAELAAGKPVSVAVTQPYGCSVKYAN